MRKSSAGHLTVKQIILSFKRQPPGRLIVLGFALVILLGTGLLLMPFSVKDGVQVSFIDALFTSTSAVCVTGLIAIDVADHFTAWGQGIVAALIQIGGLGVTSIGVGLILAARKRVGLKGRVLVKEALNVDNSKGMVRLVKTILLTTLCFELTGMILSFIVFVQDYPPLKALGISAFHSIAAFNNSGFDILGGLRNLIPYQSNILLNLTTSGLILFGGLGFLVILDILKKEKVHVTFFMTGGWVSEYPEDVKAIKAAGHDLGNHSGCRHSCHSHLENDHKDQVQNHVHHTGNQKIIKWALGISDGS